LQTRSCSCECDDQACGGDSATSRECEVIPLPILPLNLTVSGEALVVGDIMEITVTDQDGKPLVANIQLTLPDGSVVDLGDASFATYLVNQVGIWVIRASRPGYAGSSTDVLVRGVEVGWSLDKALAGLLGFLDNLLVKIVFLLLAKRRKKKKEIKSL
jgi:hypothetical protein